MLPQLRRSWMILSMSTSFRTSCRMEAQSSNRHGLFETVEEIVEDSPNVADHERLGRFTPLSQPVPAPKRKPRSFLQTYTLTPLVNDSALLRNLVDIGVNLSKFDSLYNVADWLLKLDWEKDVQPVLQFLNVTGGVPLEDLGKFVTENPWILQQPLADLHVRVKYLESKKFSKEAIAGIVTKARYWLNFHVQTIDKRLGALQKMFGLSGDELRFVITHTPKIVTLGLGYTQILQFSFKEEMGFNNEEIHQLIVGDPRLWVANKPVLLSNFNFLQNTMNFSHKAIATWPRILRVPHHVLKVRHEYLKSLGRDQYDPEKPNYVSLQSLSHYDDVRFARNIAKTTVGEFNKFAKKY